MNEITREANQRLIDEAYEHINRTGVPSVDDNEDCCYSGTGCAFTPALTLEFEDE